MSGAERTQSRVARAMVDGDGRLISADPALESLNDRAGGAIGRAFAVTPLAEVVRIAGRLGITIARAVTVADEGYDLDLWVRVEPAKDGFDLTVAGWHERPGLGRSPLSADSVGFLAAEAEWEWHCDAALRFTRLPAAAGRRHGFDAVSLLGEPLTSLFDLATGGTLIEAVAERRGFADLPATLRGSDGRVWLSGAITRDPHGAFAGFAGSTRLAEPAPSAPEPEPVTAASAFTAGLNRALRRPLAQIVANADSIHAATDGPVAPDYVGYAADIAQAGRHLLGMIDDLVDLQAVERPDFVPAADRIDLADVVGRAAGLLAVRAAQAGIAIERPIGSGRYWAAADFRRTLQILVNLIGNAVRYAPRGSIVLLRLLLNGSHVAVEVADEGKGIAPTDQARVFEKFERVDTSEPGGSGLGLYISRRLARAMGGDLTLASVPGEGATFTLTLPSAAEAASDEDQG